MALSKRHYYVLGNGIVESASTGATWGKVRACIEQKGLYASMTVAEVMTQTGLTKNEIKDLIEAGKIHQGFYGIKVG